MTSKVEKTGDIAVAPKDRSRTSSIISSLADKSEKKKKSSIKSIINFLYNPKKKTVLGRDSLNWGKR